MITHLFNSSAVSGPETLAIPALKRLGEKVSIVFLSETRLGAKSDGPVQYARELGHEVHEVSVRGRWDRKAFGELRELPLRCEVGLPDLLEHRMVDPLPCRDAHAEGDPARDLIHDPLDSAEGV